MRGKARLQKTHMTAMRAPRPAQGGVGLQWPTPLGRSTAPEARNVRATPQDLRGLGCSGGRCGGRVASTVGGGGSAQSRFLASALQRGPADHVEAPVRRGHATGQMRIGGQVCGGPTVQAAPLRIGTAAAGGALTRLGGWGGGRGWGDQDLQTGVAIGFTTNTPPSACGRSGARPGAGLRGSIRGGWEGYSV